MVYDKTKAIDVKKIRQTILADLKQMADKIKNFEDVKKLLKEILILIK